MPPSKYQESSKYASTSARSLTLSGSSGMTNQARVWHNATNLLPPSPPLSPTVHPPSFSKPSWSRQNSQNEKRKD